MPATTRSIAYLTRNCRPFGSIGRISSSGRPPRCSTDTRSTETSKRRGTSEAETPSSRQRRTMLSITACGAVEKVKTTCSTLCSSITRSRSQLAPRTGSVDGGAVDLERVVVEEPDRAQAELGAVHHALGDQLADAAGADDQRRAAALAAGDGAGAGDEEAGAARRKRHGGKDARSARSARLCTGRPRAPRAARSRPSSRRRWSTRWSGSRRADASAAGRCTCREWRTSRARARRRRPPT